MRNFAGEEVSRLVGVAFASENGYVSRELVDKMVELILANEADEKLEPLRVALGLEGNDFREGIFSWRGFLYFKWQLREVQGQLGNVMRSVDKVRVTNLSDFEIRRNIDANTKTLKQSLILVAKDCRELIALYDKAFADLVDRAHAQAFRKFLLDSPQLFLELGHLMGVVNHICSFWSFRFKDDRNLNIDAMDFEDMMTEFVTALGVDQGRIDDAKIQKIA